MRQDAQGNLHDGDGRYAEKIHSRPEGGLADPGPDSIDDTAQALFRELGEAGMFAETYNTRVNTGTGWKDGAVVRVPRGRTSAVVDLWRDEHGATRARISMAFGHETGMIDPDVVPMTNPSLDELRDAVASTLG